MRMNDDFPRVPTAGSDPIRRSLRVKSGDYVNEREDVPGEYVNFPRTQIRNDLPDAWGGRALHDVPGDPCALAPHRPQHSNLLTEDDPATVETFESFLQGRV